MKRLLKASWASTPSTLMLSCSRSTEVSQIASTDSALQRRGYQCYTLARGYISFRDLLSWLALNGAESDHSKVCRPPHRWQSGGLHAVQYWHGWLWPLRNPLDRESLHRRSDLVRAGCNTSRAIWRESSRRAAFNTVRGEKVVTNLNYSFTYKMRLATRSLGI